MNDYLVVIDKPSKIKDWDLWEEKPTYITLSTTQTILSANSEERAIEKCKSLYKGCAILKISKL